MKMIGVLLSALFLATLAQAEDPEAPLSFCMFGPKVRVFSAYHPGEKCKGSAKVQAMIWECTAPENVSEKVESNRKKAVTQAKEECIRHCRKFGSKCKGSFDMPARCGLESDLEEAIAAGRKLGCRKECSGNAFTFCSIYDAGYRMLNEEMLAKQPANCHCYLDE